MTSLKKIIIRLAGETDVNALSNLYFEFHEFHAKHLPAFLQSLGEPTETDRLKLSQEIINILKGNDSAILVAEEAGRIIAFSEVHLKRPDLNDRAKMPSLYAHLQSLSVTEASRRDKIGTLLLHATEDWARQHGAHELRLEIWEFPAGPLEFYQKSGYRTFRRSLLRNL